MKRVAVTGANGFIGNRVVENLEERRISVVRVDASEGVDILGPKLYAVLDGPKVAKAEKTAK